MKKQRRAIDRAAYLRQEPLNYDPQVIVEAPKLEGEPLSRAIWLCHEMNFVWSADLKQFVLLADRRVRIPLPMVVEARTSYATFQRATLIILERAGRRLSKRD